MKVLIYSKVFLPVTGGIQTVVSVLARGLAERERSLGNGKIEVTVVTQTKANSEDDLLCSYRIVRSPTLLELAGLMRKSDVIHIAGATILPIALALLCGKPMVVEHHGFQAACPNGLLFYEPTETPCPGHYMAGRYDKCMECNRKKSGLPKSVSMLLLTPVRRWLLNRARANIMPTDWLATVLKLERMRTVYHGIPAQPVDPLALAEPPTFAFQGRLVSTKGAKLLLRAAESMLESNQEFRIVIVGEGPERQDLQSQMSEALSRRVQLLGHVPDDQLGEVLKDASVVVMPSLGGEVFGLVAAENMMRGKLLIISDIGAMREVVGETGLVFPAGDAEELAMCMKRAINEPDLALRLGESARRRAMQTFDVDSMIERHVSLYDEVLSGRRKRSSRY
jgi:glycosyltransferase involved in cell wall biosynthesis